MPRRAHSTVCDHSRRCDRSPRLDPASPRRGRGRTLMRMCIEPFHDPRERVFEMRSHRSFGGIAIAIDQRFANGEMLGESSLVRLRHIADDGLLAAIYQVAHAFHHLSKPLVVAVFERDVVNGVVHLAQTRNALGACYCSSRPIFLQHLARDLFRHIACRQANCHALECHPQLGREQEECKIVR